MPRLPDDIPDVWHRQWLDQQSPELRKQYAESDALAAELAAERPAFVGLSDAPLFPSQRFDAPRAPAAQPSRGEEVDLVERARLNVVDQFYRGTLNGAIALRALAARANGPNDPEPDIVARAEQGVLGAAVPSRDQARSEYRAIVADLQKYDRIRPSSSWLEYGVTGVGQIAGGIPTPESLAGLPGRGATLLGRMAIAGAKTAGLNVGTDVGVQNLSIGSKVQEKYDWVRTAAAAPIGFVIGAGVGALGSVGARSDGRRSSSAKALRLDAEASGGATNSVRSPYELPASSFVGSIRRPLQAPEGPPRNPPGEFRGTPYSGHAFDQMQNRGIPPNIVDQAIRHGKSRPGDESGIIHHYDPTNNISVIRDSETGRVITVRPRD